MLKFVKFGFIEFGEYCNVVKSKVFILVWCNIYNIKDEFIKKNYIMNFEKLFIKVIVFLKEFLEGKL